MTQARAPGEGRASALLLIDLTGETEYHVGADLEGEDPMSLLLPDTVVPGGLTFRETIEACRALPYDYR